MGLWSPDGFCRSTGRMNGPKLSSSRSLGTPAQTIQRLQIRRIMEELDAVSQWGPEIGSSGLTLTVDDKRFLKFLQFPTKARIE